MNRPGRWLLLALVVGGAATGAWYRWRRVPTLTSITTPGTRVAQNARRGVESPPPDAPEARAPDSVRVKVEVLNASGIRGLGRKATFALRDAGYDVVSFGNAPDTTKQDSSVVIDRSGHAEWAKRVAVAIGGARVESRPDSSRYLDVTVLLGATWRPSSKAFYP